MKTILTGLIIFIATETINAQVAGTLDSSFGGTGKIATSITNTVDRISALALQTDGKILAGGGTNIFSTGDFCIVRYLVNGNLDSTFGINGVVTTEISNGNDVITNLKLQPDGKIVVAGQTSNGNDIDFAVARYETNGTLDTTFGVNGIQTTMITAGNDYANTLLIDTLSNSIYVVGSSNSPNSFLVKYTSSGVLDSSMNSTGIKYINFGSPTVISNISFQTDNSIVCGGSLQTFNLKSDFLIARFDTTGTLDTTFGINGYTLTEISPDYDQILSVKILSDGKIIAGGSADLGGNLIEDFALTKYSKDGIIDSTFGINGIASTNINNEDFFRDLAIQADGKIIAAGGANYTGSNPNFALVRYNVDGSLDSSFGNNGITITDFTGNNDLAYSVAIQNDYKILVGGFARTNLVNSNFALARYFSGLNVGLLDFSQPVSTLLAYPNPVTNYAYINYTLAADEQVSITLHDVSGRMVKTFAAHAARLKGEQTEHLYLDEGIECGVYFLRIGNGSEMRSVKLVKQ